MTIEQLSEKIMALRAECKALLGSRDVSLDSTTGPNVHMNKYSPASLAAFISIDTPVSVFPHNGYYRASKHVGGVEYFILLNPEDDLGLMPVDVTDAVTRYLETKKQIKEAS